MPLKPTHSIDIEAQLAGVFEQDGITMASAEGLHRRVKRSRKKTARSMSRVASVETRYTSSIEDPVASMDAAAVGLLITTKEGMRSRTVPIRYEEHQRSPFVLSLRSILHATHSAPPQDERLPVQAALAAHRDPQAGSIHAGVYGTLTQDLCIDGVDPRVFAEQFTSAPSAWMQSWKAMAPFQRIAVVIRDVGGDIWELLQRVQRVEQRVAAEVQDTLEVVEIRRFSPARAMVGFMALLCLVTLPANAIAIYRTTVDTKDAVEGIGQQAVNALLSAKDAGSLPSSLAALQQASSHFREADAMLTESHGLALGLSSLVPAKYRAARALLEVGDKTSEAGRILGLGFLKVFEDPTRHLDERLGVLATYARGVLPLLQEAEKAAASVSPSSLPEDRRESFQKLTTKLQAATESVREFAVMADVLAVFAGKDQARTYLLIFQNQTELRPTGGFMGSVAEVTLDHGTLKKMFVPPGGTYDIKGQLLEHVVSPEPMHLINPSWQFQDANWFPDFPTSAKKIRWFWSKSGQPTVDGVIAINASFVERLLDITGPIDMPEYGKVINRANFLLETQKAVEVEYDRVANTPKKFVGDLSKAMMEHVKKFTNEQWLQVAGLVSDSLQIKDIQVAFSSEEEERLAERYGWNGQLKETNGDSLAIIEANIAGQKTDGVIEEKTDMQVEIQADGSIIDRVTLTRTHRGQKGEQFRGVRNVSYIRAYVPKGSELMTATGFQTPSSTLFKKPEAEDRIDSDLAASEGHAELVAGGVRVSDEGSRTVFGGWAQLDPGATQQLTYTYRLPFTVRDIYGHLDAAPDEQIGGRTAYLLLLTSQSGKTTRTIHLSIHMPDTWTIPWKRGIEQGSGSAPLEYNGAWDRDRVIAALFASPELTH